jgi:DNA-binding beta-propeller fold protein YncE
VTVVSSGPAKGPSVVDEYVAKLPKRAPSDTSEIIFSDGRFKFKVLNDWAKLPADIQLLAASGIATDKDDKVYVFNRAEHPVLIFDRDGNLLSHWGKGVFKNPHGIFVGPDGMIYCADDGDHTVRKCTPDGKVLMTLGTPGKPAPYMSGEPFARCTDVALSPKGEIYVTDGYYNARVHKFSPDGKLILSWGSPGTNKGEFNIVHNIICDADGWVYVCDRENHRVQIFDGNGKYETQWVNMHSPNSIDQSKGGGEKLFYITESGPSGSVNKWMPNCGPNVLILDAKGDRLAMIGTNPQGTGPDRFKTAHGGCVDSRGDIYVGDNAGAAPNEYNKVFALRKLVKVAG